MAENDGAASKTAAPPRPTISLPSRSAFESIFTRGADTSPGPMTLVSSFFSENDPESECRSFSQLLAGAMASPGAVSPRVPSSGLDVSDNSAGERDAGGGLRFKQNRPFNLVIAQSPMFTVPPGLSPASLLDSPGFFSPGQGHFGMSHQQALAQVTAQAVQSQSHNQAGYASLPTGTITSAALPIQPIPLQQLQPIASNPKTLTTGQLQMSQSDQRSQPTGPTADKPADDGYNWRKYGQKLVKGSEYPRSYYKCTHPNCPVKKKVERSVDGHVTEIIYKGQHNHAKPQPNKRAKEGAVLPSTANEINGNVDLIVNPESGSVGQLGNMSRPSDGTGTVSISRQDQESGHATTEQLSGSSDGEEVGDIETRTDGRDKNDEPDPKRRNLETTVVSTRVIESAGSHKTVTEPRIVVQTTSEVDLLDDGYKWRKYGQKVVKGNPHPRSYYKCTTAGCNVRKHVERASNDSKSVITTYEGKHNHEVPAGKNSGHYTANSSVQSKVQSSAENKNVGLSKVDATNGNRRVASLVRMKDEHDIT
ncbi:probable WRKY transcription factor 4 isoform X2 [Aristolochia californica]|uniref:probable WRKY transcription factor 4 isoform X2 n=1 Tax=Aristolochia californica TaxID=171875 RepID=UPI0035E21ECC